MILGVGLRGGGPGGTPPLPLTPPPPPPRPPPPPPPPLPRAAIPLPSRLYFLQPPLNLPRQLQRIDRLHQHLSTAGAEALLAHFRLVVSRHGDGDARGVVGA